MLRARARLLESIRHFFSRHGVMEVDTPVLSAAAVTDPNIASLSLVAHDGVSRYLHTSPEFPMKRLLCAGSGDIYQFSKVFRAAEEGPFHNPEFSLLEWYRIDYDHQRLMREVDELIREVWRPEKALPPSEFISYSRAIENATACRLPELDCDKVRQILIGAGHPPPDSMPEELDPWLDLLMIHLVAPAFPTDRMTFVYDYPASQAALAVIRADDPPVAERFELFFGEVECANGFHELRDADEQLQRFKQDLQKRRSLGLPAVPLDSRLIDALTAGLPPCAGVALGIDRLLMVMYDKQNLREVMSFPFPHA